MKPLSLFRILISIAIVYHLLVILIFPGARTSYVTRALRDTTFSYAQSLGLHSTWGFFRTRGLGECAIKYSLDGGPYQVMSPLDTNLFLKEISPSLINCFYGLRLSDRPTFVGRYLCHKNSNAHEIHMIATTQENPSLLKNKDSLTDEKKDTHQISWEKSVTCNTP